MKKLICTLLSLTTALSLTACAGKGPAPQDSSGDKAPAKKTTETVYLPKEKTSYMDDGQLMSKTTYEYDDRGLMLKETVYAQVTETTYDEKEDVYISKYFPCDDIADIARSWTYDDYGNLTSYRYSTLNDDGVLEPSMWYDFTYTYDDEGKVTVFRYRYERSGQGVIADDEYTADYDAAGNVVKLWSKPTGSDEEPQCVADYTYDDQSRLTSFHLHEKILYDFTYDANGQLQTYTGKFGSNDILRFDCAFTFDGAGRLIKEESAIEPHNFFLSYTYEDGVLTDVAQRAESVFELDEQGNAIRPVGEGYQYSYQAIELSPADADLARYHWRSQNDDPISGLTYIAAYSDYLYPHFLIVRHPIYGFGPLLPGYSW